MGSERQLHDHASLLSLSLPFFLCYFICACVYLSFLLAFLSCFSSHFSLSGTFCACSYYSSRRAITRRFQINSTAKSLIYFFASYVSLILYVFYACISLLFSFSLFSLLRHLLRMLVLLKQKSHHIPFESHPFLCFSFFGISSSSERVLSDPCVSPLPHMFSFLTSQVPSTHVHTTQAEEPSQWVLNDAATPPLTGGSSSPSSSTQSRSHSASSAHSGRYTSHISTSRREPTPRTFPNHHTVHSVSVHGLFCIYRSCV